MIAVSLKQDEPVAEYAKIIESLAKVIGHSTQIFTYNDEISAFTFEGEDAEEILEIVPDIGTVASTHAVWNPVKAGEAHDMIEANCACRA